MPQRSANEASAERSEQRFAGDLGIGQRASQHRVHQAWRPSTCVVGSSPTRPTLSKFSTPISLIAQRIPHFR